MEVRRRCPVGNSAPAHTRVGNQTVRFFGSDVRTFLFDATRNTDRFEDKAVVQDRIELLRGIAHLTMVNAIIGGGGSCDFPTDSRPHVYPPYSVLGGYSYTCSYCHCW